MFTYGHLMLKHHNIKIAASKESSRINEVVIDGRYRKYTEIIVSRPYVYFDYLHVSVEIDHYFSTMFDKVLDYVYEAKRRIKHYCVNIIGSKEHVYTQQTFQDINKLIERINPFHLELWWFSCKDHKLTVEIPIIKNIYSVFIINQEVNLKTDFLMNPCAIYRVYAVQDLCDIVEEFTKTSRLQHHACKILFRRSRCRAMLEKEWNLEFKEADETLKSRFRPLPSNGIALYASIPSEHGDIEIFIVDGFIVIRRKETYDGQWEDFCQMELPNLDALKLTETDFIVDPDAQNMCFFPLPIFTRISEMLSPNDFYNLAQTCHYMHWRMFKYGHLMLKHHKITASNENSRITEVVTIEGKPKKCGGIIVLRPYVYVEYLHLTFAFFNHYPPSMFDTMIDYVSKAKKRTKHYCIRIFDLSEECTQPTFQDVNNLIERLNPLHLTLHLSCKDHKLTVEIPNIKNIYSVYLLDTGFFREKETNFLMNPCAAYTVYTAQDLRDIVQEFIKNSRLQFRICRLVPYVNGDFWHFLAISFCLHSSPKTRVKDLVESTFDGIAIFCHEYRRYFNWAFYAAIILLYHVFLVFAAIHNFTKAETLIILTCLIWLYIICSKVLLPYLGPTIYRMFLRPAMTFSGRCWQDTRVRYVVYGFLLLAVTIFLIIDTSEDRRRLIGLGGIFLFLLTMYIISKDRRKIDWRPVTWGFGVQFILGIIVLRWPWGHRKFQQLSNIIVTFLDYTNNGTAFVYGFLAQPPNICGTSPVFFFTSLQVVIFFGSVVSLLYHFGIMQAVVKRIAWCLQKTLRTTATESLNACACVFLGQAESPLLIQPYLEKMTASELHAVMTSGFSCIAGSLFSAYVAFGACPLYLMSSTVMSASGSLACSKMLFPETEESQLKRVADLKLPKGEESSALECISSGAVSAVGLVAAIAANLIVFLALLAFIDAIFNYAGELLGYHGWSFDDLLAYIFFPVAFVMGVTDSSAETLRVAQLMGTKTTLNEFIAYQKLGTMVSAQPPLIGPRAAMIATYALCGFSNFSSIGIQLGVLGGMAPSRKTLLAKIVLRALLAGCISCFFTATVAGILVKNPTHCAVRSASDNCLNVELLQRVLNNISQTS